VNELEVSFINIFPYLFVRIFKCSWIVFRFYNIDQIIICYHRPITRSSPGSSSTSSCNQFYLLPPNAIVISHCITLYPLQFTEEEGHEMHADGW